MGLVTAKEVAKAIMLKNMEFWELFRLAFNKH
jgi:hypothetical protein